MLLIYLEMRSTHLILCVPASPVTSVTKNNTGSGNTSITESETKEGEQLSVTHLPRRRNIKVRKLGDTNDLQERQQKHREDHLADRHRVERRKPARRGDWQEVRAEGWDFERDLKADL